MGHAIIMVAITYCSTTVSNRKGNGIFQIHFSLNISKLVDYNIRSDSFYIRISMGFFCEKHEP